MKLILRRIVVDKFDDRVNNILLKLQDCKVDVNKTIDEINNLECVSGDVIIKEKSQSRARKIKIYVDSFDDKSGKRTKINLPGIPFWLIKLIGVPFIKAAINSKEVEVPNDKIEKVEKAKNIGLKAYDVIIKKLLDELSEMPPFEIVSVDSKDAKVHIYTK